MATKITPADIKRINELYYTMHTYAAVAREMGISAGTVKRYVDPNWHPIDNSKIKHFYLSDLPEVNVDMFKGLDTFGILCLYKTEDERAEIRELWEELEQ